MARERKEKSSRRTPKSGNKLQRLLLLTLVGLIVLVALAPTILTQKSILKPIINQYSGLQPVEADFEAVRAGWFTPVSISGFKLNDSEGQLLAKVQEVSTGKNLFSWIFNSSDLGQITVSGLESTVVVKDGESNLEKAFAHLLSTEEEPTAEDEEAPAGAKFTGSLVLENSKLMLAEHDRPERWIIQVASAEIQLPQENQLIGPIVVDALLGEASGNRPDKIGSLVANISQDPSNDNVQLSITAKRLPLDVFHVAKARLQDLPVDALSGNVTAKISGELSNENQWQLNVNQLQAFDLYCAAPTIVGEQPAKMKVFNAQVKAALNGNRLVVDDTSFTCDFAAASTAASIPWPLQSPSLADPFIDGAVIQAAGTIDLPKLSAAAQTLLPIREEAQLLAGSANFEFTHGQISKESNRPLEAKKLGLAFQLKDLKAQASGQLIEWTDPVTITLSASENNNTTQYGLTANADFLKAEGLGDADAGSFGGDINLDLLGRKISKFVELPFKSMSGNARLNFNWKTDASQQLIATANLNTSPMQFVSTTGGVISEPAWEGEFSAKAMLNDVTDQRINEAHCTLTASGEELKIDLLEPVSISSTPDQPQQKTLPAAKFSCSLAGDLANWKRRGVAFLSEPPEFDVSGQLKVSVGGRLDMQHALISQASWNGDRISFSNESYAFNEPQIVGSFKGNVDTQDLTQLQIELLQVQSTSLSLGARDSASPQGDGRVGQANFRVDLSRVLNNLNSVASATTPADESQLTGSGNIEGRINWQITPELARTALAVAAKDVNLLRQTKGTLQPEPVWNEPEINSTLQGQWDAETGNVDVSQLSVTMPWFNYQGNLKYLTNNSSEPQASQTITSSGQATYSSETLSNKLASFTGNQLQLAGQQTVPIEVKWQSPQGDASALSGLLATTRLGWQQAKVAGIDVGNADVPVRIDSGILTTAAEIPVSGGTLRWDIRSDLTQDNLVIVQKPMKVLENVEITEQMCSGWLKFVTPLLAEATSVDGRLSLQLNDAKLTPADPARQTVAGQLVIHQAQVGPGPLSNQVISMVKQIDAIRKQDYTQAVSSQQRVWLQVPEQLVAFEMRDGRVIHRNLIVDVGDAQIQTSGSVGVDGTMDMLAAVPIPDNWIEKSPLLAGMKGQSLQFPMGGTISQPQVNTDLLKQFGRQTMQNAAQGLIQQGLSRGLEKLFGSPDSP